jgi:ceramide glucosyltransferase
VDLALIVLAACACWWGLCTLQHIGSVILAILQPAVRRRQETNRQRPPVSIAIPVKDMEPELRAAFESAFEQSYPEFEILISASEEASAALLLAREVRERFPAVASRIVSNDARIAVSPKLNNLVAPLSLAQHDLIFVKDANIRLRPEQLGRFVRSLTSEVGLVVAIPVACEPKNFMAEVEAAIMNGYDARLLAAGSAFGLGFGHGKVLLFDRRAFTNAGGVPAISHAINEDHYLSKALAAIGLKTVFSSEVVRQFLGERKFADVWNRHLRWTVCRRQSEPWAFYGEPTCSGLLAAAAGAAGAPLLGQPATVVFAATLLFWFAAESILLLARGWGWSWRAPIAMLVREFVVLALWVWTWRARRIFWGDIAFDLRQAR